MTKAAQNFIDQYTRKLLIDWAHHQITSSLDISIPPPLTLESCGSHQCAYGYAPYVEHAIAKGWLSKDGKRVLAKGLAVATSALKRGSG